MMKTLLMNIISYLMGKTLLKIWNMNTMMILDMMNTMRDINLEMWDRNLS